MNQEHPQAQVSGNFQGALVFLWEVEGSGPAWPRNTTLDLSVVLPGWLSQVLSTQVLLRALLGTGGRQGTSCFRACELSEVSLASPLLCGAVWVSSP